MRSLHAQFRSLAVLLPLLAGLGCHDINSAVPDPAEAGEEVTIFGGGFGASQGTSVVRYDGQELAVVSWSETAIVATLPATIADGTYALEVTVKQDTQAIAHTIGVPSVGTPDITSVIPSPAIPGDDISIYGGGFGANQGTGWVLYDGEQLAIVSWSDTLIVATLPAAKADGIYELTVKAAQDSVSIPHTIEVPGMVLVPEGTFTMGSDAGGSDEQPVHDVQLDAFHIDQTEVTVADYQVCVDDRGACTTPNTGGSCTWGAAGKEQHPVNCVDWFQATDYCAWAGKRLPTEAEWEKAARGTDGRTYPWGGATPTCERAQFSGCPDDTIAVGSLPLGDSPYGAWDMSGNVWEWVNDWYSSTYYAVSPPSNPQGPETGTSRVISGGSWLSTTFNLRAARRDFFAPSFRGDFIGFRCARDG